MATLVSFHAHPDDEAIACGGTLAQAAADGHRVVVVVATRGERGEVPEGMLRDGETLAERRTSETAEAARILGVHRLEFLGYVDSGMPGAPTNDDPRCFWQADVEEAAERLAAILRDESAEVVTIYEPNGVTRHPDHVQVHRVGSRATELAGTPRVYESTVNRTQVQRLVGMAAEAGVGEPPSDIDLSAMGTPEDEITTAVDVRPYLAVKRRAMAAHASQISETSIFLAMPEHLFAEVWGTEWYVRRGAAPGGPVESSLFDGLG